MRDLTAFTARLNALFGAGHEARYNTLVHRYEIVSPSADGKEVSQFWCWFEDPVSGERLEPDPVTGLLPFRELDWHAENEIIANMQASFVGSPTEGRGSWRKQFRSRLAKNSALRQKAVMDRANALSTMIYEMNLARPWLKHHSGSAASRRVAMRI